MKKLFLMLTVGLLLSGCGYKFSGASIPAEMKTLSVKYIENNAQLVVPTLSSQFTEDLQTRIRTQSRLALVTKDGDGSIEGKITDYDIKPIAIQDNAKPVAGANRLTITVSIKYVNRIKGHEKESFEQSFTAFTDFSLAGQTLANQQEALIKKVTTQLTENIFNRAFAQW